MSGNAPQEDAPPPQPKEDPETLVLRGRPRPVVRFRRGLIIGVTGTVSTCLIALTWFALEPPSFRVIAEDEPKERPVDRAPEALANAPKSYGDVPQLGPPLPGDLGRPILEHQRRIESSPPPEPHRAAALADRRLAAAEAERQRHAATEEAARGSALLIQLAGRPGGVGERSAAADTLLSPSGSAGEGPSPAPAAGPQQRKLEFGKSEGGAVSPHSVRPAPSSWTLSAGTVIPASLITGLNSDLPGMVLAQVTENVSDSATGRTVLVPQGARLVGRYDSVVAYGQRRALLVWQRIVFPDGSSIQLDNMPATDLAGYAGVEDKVDFHTWRLLKGIALSTLLGVGTELSLGKGESDLVRAVREATQQNAARAGEQITARNLDVQPTLTVRPGWPLRAIINKDLVLRPWRE